MRRPLKIVGFALGGVLIAAAMYAYFSFHDYTKPPNAFDVALGIVSFIALLNGGFYAAVGAIVLRYRKHNTDI